MRKPESRNWGTPQEPPDFARLAGNDLRYKLQPERIRKKVLGGVFIDTPVGCIMKTAAAEESDEVSFNSPSNPPVEREFYPLGIFEASLDVMEGLGEKRG